MLVRRLETSSCRLVDSSAIDRAIKDDVIDEVERKKCADESVIKIVEETK